MNKKDIDELLRQAELNLASAITLLHESLPEIADYEELFRAVIKAASTAGEIKGADRALNIVKQVAKGKK